ncbi:MAG: hypothetical protein AAGH78_14010 [Cyanobacteria bacterium P01_H01_bin.58]
MTMPSRFTPTERLESLKAGCVGGACGGVVSLAEKTVNMLLTPGQAFVGLFSTLNLASLTLLVNIAVNILSGALFALTYRYAVRGDNNPQLKIGVVLAFSLVRGLAQVDAGSAIAQNFWPFLAACGESFFLFSVTALVLNVAQQRQWFTPFDSAAQE